MNYYGITLSDSYFSHHGVKGQKWGVRNEKKSKNKKHLGIDEKGNINFIEGKTSKTAKKKFLIKSTIAASGIALSVYLRKHPEVVMKGINAINKHKNMSIANLKDNTSGIYSKKLKRMLTIEEAIAAGLY